MKSSVGLCIPVVTLLSLAAPASWSTGPADTIVVPAGTEIRVEFTQPRPSQDVSTLNGKVAVPVRVGWATAIPASSEVELAANAGVLEAVSITVGKVKYKVKTSAMPLSTSAPGSDSEVGFALKDPLEIAR